MMTKLLTTLGTFLSKAFSYKDEHFDEQIYIRYFFWQKLLRINGKVPWPVHYTSYVTGIKNIEFGNLCSPGSNVGQYIQATNKIIMGDNVLMGPGSKIISSNHDLSDFTRHIRGQPVKIGSNVWIGADVVILPEVTIGDNVVIGAGSIVTKSIPSNSIAVGNPCRKIKDKAPYTQ